MAKCWIADSTQFGSITSVKQRSHEQAAPLKPLVIAGPQGNPASVVLVCDTCYFMATED